MNTSNLESNHFNGCNVLSQPGEVKCTLSIHHKTLAGRSRERLRHLSSKLWLLALLVITASEVSYAGKDTISTSIGSMRTILFNDEGPHKTHDELLDEDDNYKDLVRRRSEAMQAAVSVSGPNAKPTGLAKALGKQIDEFKADFRQRYEKEKLRHLSLPISQFTRFYNTRSGKIKKAEYRSGAKRVVQTFKNTQEVSETLTKFAPMILGVKALLSESVTQKRRGSASIESAFVFQNFLTYETVTIPFGGKPGQAEAKNIPVVAARYKKPSEALKALSTDEYPMQLVSKDGQTKKTMTAIHPDLIVVRPVLHSATAGLHILEAIMVKNTEAGMELDKYRFSFVTSEAIEPTRQIRVMTATANESVQIVALPTAITHRSSESKGK